MFRISGINSGLNYKVNPIFQKRAEILKKASEEYTDLERKMQSNCVSPSVVDKFIKAEKNLEVAKSDLKNVSRVVKGGNLDKDKALTEANELTRKIDYYC